MYDILIIGGGIGGLSAAYYLRESNLDVALISDKFGGRIHSISMKNKSHDMGAEYFIDQDIALVELIKSLDLEMEEYLSTRAIFNEQTGQSVIFPNEGDSFITSIKRKLHMIRYIGIKNLNSANLLKEKLDDWKKSIDELYEIFSNATIETIHRDAKKLTSKYWQDTLNSYLESEGFGEKFISSMIDPLFRAIYMLGADEMNAAFGIMGFASKKSTVLHVKNGNSKLIEELQSNITADIFNQKACGISKIKNGYSVKMDTGEEINSRLVYLAIPAYNLKDLLFNNFSDDEMQHLQKFMEIPYNPNVYHHLINGTTNEKISKLFQNGSDSIYIANPSMICEINKVRNQTFDITSSCSSTETNFDLYFDEYEIIKSIHWHPAYPKYTPETISQIPTDISINDSFFIGSDNFISSMGNSILVSKLLVELINPKPQEDSKLSHTEIPI